jgi:type I restriction enzyme, S subunit
MTRLKHVSTVQTGVTLSGEGDQGDPEWPYLRVANVQVGYVDLREIKTVRVPPDKVATSTLQPGDVLMTEGGDIDKLGRGALWRGELPDMLHQNHIFAVRPDKTLDSEFLVYWLDGPVARTYFRTTAKQTTNLAGTNKWTLGNLPVPAPPLDEQRRLVKTLDDQTAKIDTLIEEQQRLIEMLRERRVATITEALDGHEMTRLRRLVDPERPMTYGILQCGPLVDGGVVYIGPSDIIGEGRSPARTALRTTSPEIAAAYQRSVLAGGDIVVSIGPAYGKAAVVSEDLSGGNLTQDTVRVALRSDLAYTRFVVWTLLSRQTIDYWDYEIMGATFRRLNLGTLARTPIPLPSLDEQRRIAVYLDEQTAKIDALIAETERFIELARERRVALITAAVTGQIDVREMA